MQADGNLVVIAPGNRPVWVSRTAGRGRSTLRVQDDGNVVVYGPRGPTWSWKAKASKPPAAKKPRPIKRLPPAPAPVPGLPPAPDPAPPPPRNLRAEADAIMNMSYVDFINFKRRHRPAPFNWFDNGCSFPTPPGWKQFFDKLCQLHDFGYRNYGRAPRNWPRLQLAPNEDMREHIDARFLYEAKRKCKDSYDRWWETDLKLGCYNAAGAMWTALRHGGRDAFYG